MKSGDYDNILFIDATSSPLGDDDFDTYVEYSAMANYYHVIKAIHVPEEYAEGTIRVTFGAENTEEEAVTIAESLVGILKTM